MSGPEPETDLRMGKSDDATAPELGTYVANEVSTPVLHSDSMLNLCLGKDGKNLGSKMHESAYLATEAATGLCVTSKQLSEQVSEQVNEIAPVAQEFALEAQVRAEIVAEQTKEKVSEAYEEFFSPEQKKQREELANQIFATLQLGLLQCHGGADSLVAKVFDRPVKEVEVTGSINEIGTTANNESSNFELTVDSALREPIGENDDDAIKNQKNESSVPVPSDSVERDLEVEFPIKPTSLLKKDEECIDDGEEKKEVFLIPTTQGTIEHSQGLEPSLTTDSDIYSVDRFREELYKEHFRSQGQIKEADADESKGILEDKNQDRSHAKKVDYGKNQSNVSEKLQLGSSKEEISNEYVFKNKDLDTLLQEEEQNYADGDEESRNGLEAYEQPSMDEINRTLRIDIEKLDEVVEKTLRSLEKSSPAATRPYTSTGDSTPLRANQQVKREIDFVDLSHVNASFDSSLKIQKRSYPSKVRLSSQEDPTVPVDLTSRGMRKAYVRSLVSSGTAATPIEVESVIEVEKDAQADRLINLKPPVTIDLTMYDDSSLP